MSFSAMNLHEHKEANIMLDIETLGVSPGSVICSLAAVHFDLDGSVLSTFHQRITIQSCLDVGLTVNGDTLDFWFKQSDTARAEVCGGDRLPLAKVLRNFSLWLHDIDSNFRDYLIWGNSSDFDCSILAAAYQAAKIPIPWMWWGTRCVRTISSLFPEIKKGTPFEGTIHNPLDDARHQVKYLVATLARIRRSVDIHKTNASSSCREEQV